MTFTCQIIGWWIVLSCTIGPCLTWLVFYDKRQRRDAREMWRDRHPGHVPARVLKALFQ